MNFNVSNARTRSASESRRATLVLSGLVACGAALTGLCAPSPAAAADERIVVMTPYLSSVATKEIVDAFEAAAQTRAWQVSVIDTKGDIGTLANRLEDVVASRPDAIVLVSLDPSVYEDQIAAATDAGVPVIAADGALVDGIALNVTSDNRQMGRLLSEFIAQEVEDEGGLVQLYHSAHPGVRQRELALEDVMAEKPGLEIVDSFYVTVPGPIDASRIAMENILRARGQSIEAVWAAWDEPAIGAVLAIQSMGLEQSGILVAGIDGNPQAIEMIRECTPLVATVAQNFSEMAAMAASGLDEIFSGTLTSGEERYAPATLITRETLGVSCG